MDIEDIGWVLITSILGGGGAVWAGFKFFGEALVKHHLQKDLERAKSEISLHASRRMKLHDKEYEVFPEMWALLCDARESLNACVQEFRSLPDVNNMSDADYKEWVSELDLSKNEADFLMAGGDRLELVNRVLDYKKIISADEKFRKFRDYFERSRIFLGPEFDDLLNEISSALRAAWAHRQTHFTIGDRVPGKDYLLKALEVLEKRVDPQMEKIAVAMKAKFTSVGGD